MLRRKPVDESLSARFILPVMLENILTMLIGLVFSGLISKISTSALAAIGMSNTIMAVIFAMFSVVTTGTTLLISRQIGAQEYEQAGVTVEQSIWLTILASSLLAAGCIIFAPFLLRLLMPTAQDQLFSEALRYFRMLMISLPFYVLHGVLSGVMRALGNSRSCMIAAIVMNLVQLFAAWVLISLMQLEEIGAGLSYVICRIAGAVMVLAALRSLRKYFTLRVSGMIKPAP